MVQRPGAAGVLPRPLCTFERFDGVALVPVSVREDRPHGAQPGIVPDSGVERTGLLRDAAQLDDAERRIEMQTVLCAGNSPVHAHHGISTRLELRDERDDAVLRRAGPREPRGKDGQRPLPSRITLVKELERAAEEGISGTAVLTCGRALACGDE